jgi:hypothetical protein
MNLYLTFLKIPEVASLTPNQRRFVKSQCLFWLLLRLPFRGSSIAVTVVCIFGGLYASQRLNFGFWWTAATIGIAGGVLGHLHDMIWFAHWRPEVARFIQLHAAEIETIA